MKLRKMVLRERELNKSIEFLLEELDMITDLMSTEKYKNSSTLLERFDRMSKKVEILIQEKKELKHILDMLEMAV